MAESRLLFEIGRDGSEIRDLRCRLSLDSGYVSRLLRSLKQQRLVITERSDNDSRVKRVILTTLGLAELQILNQRSDEVAKSLLAPLTLEQRQALIDAMTCVERLMRTASVQIVVESVATTDAEYCLGEYYTELDQRFEGGFDVKQSISAEPEELKPPNGIFVIARSDRLAVGCGALKVKDNNIAEIKRMWVSKTVRGLGIGRRILETLEQYATEFGVDILRLETNRTLKEAQALYRANGFAEVKPFNDETYAHHWFEKRIPAQPKPG